MRTRTILLLAAAAALLAGCGGGDDDGGGDGTKTFDDAEFAVTFEYPSEFEPVDKLTIESEVGGDAEATEALSIGEHDLLIVSSYELNVEVTDENIAQIKPEVDNVMSQASGAQLSGERVTVGGFPGYVYEFDLDEPEVHSRMFVVFDGKTEYTLNCQSTAAKRAEITEACEQAVETFAKR